MSDLIELGARYLWNDGMLKPILKEFEGEDWTQRPGEGNSALWMTGHLAYARRIILRILGEDVPKADWEEQVGLGSNGDLNLATFPSPQDLLGDFDTQGKRLIEKFEAMSDEDAATALDKPLPFNVKTKGEAAHFFYMHETYHVGQLGLIRRFLKKPNDMA